MPTEKINRGVKPVAAFIDANVFLSFYAYTNDDLKQLKQVKNLIERRALVLYQPDQVFAEISRNRETKIAEALAEFHKEKLSVKLPIFMREMDDAKAFYDACSEAEQRRLALVSQARKQAANRTLPADDVIEQILAASLRLEVNDRIFLLAMRRNRVGNPPGKGGSSRIGDEVNWETLLAHCPAKTDLHIVSKDGDFRSALDKEAPKGFLLDEWKDKNGGKLILHNEFGPFLSTIDTEIKLATDAKKQELIQSLNSSPSFASTHAAISELRPYMSLLTPADAERLLRRAIQNPQISKIAGDADVAEFYKAILNEHMFDIDLDLSLEIFKLFKDATQIDETDDEIPF